MVQSFMHMGTAFFFEVDAWCNHVATNCQNAFEKTLDTD